MITFDAVIGDIESALAKLKQMKADSEEVEKARDKLRARRRPRKNGDTQ